MTTTKSKLPTCKTVAFSVLKKFHANPFPGQRSHRLHLKEADYLHGKSGNTKLTTCQLVFEAVRFMALIGGIPTLVTYLVDGYTRVEACLQGLMETPDRVMLLTHTVKDYDAAYELYCRYNSVKASKKGKHQIQSGIREASALLGSPTDSFNSHLMLKGSLTSGIRYSGLVGRDLHEKTCNGYKVLCQLDSLKLDSEKGNTAAMMGIYIAIMSRDGDHRMEHVAYFLEKFNHPNGFVGKLKGDEDIQAARLYYDSQRKLKLATGNDNVMILRDRILGHYTDFLHRRTRRASTFKATEQAFTLGQFKAAA